MVWRIEIAPAAKKELDKLDRQTARRILTFLQKRVILLKDPRSIGDALKVLNLENIGGIEWETIALSSGSKMMFC